jgi:hypothetical protein
MVKAALVPETRYAARRTTVIQLSVLLILIRPFLSADVFPGEEC